MADYDDFKAEIVATAGINPTDTDFYASYNGILLKAEFRIYRDLDPLVGRKMQQATFGGAAPANAQLATPDDCLIMRTLDYFTPIGTLDNRFPIERRSEDFCNDYWPARGTTALPKYFCDLKHNQLLVVPSANATYKVEMAYTFRAPSLAVALLPNGDPPDGTQTTVLSTVYEDLLFAAVMVGVAGYKKNYGTASDDPQEGMTWEKTYQSLLNAARLEEKRRKSGEYADESPSEPPEQAPIT